MTTERTPQDVLRELRRLSEAATPGPWIASKLLIYRANDEVTAEVVADPASPKRGRERILATTFGERPSRNADAELIAAAVNYVRSLDKAIAEAPDSPGLRDEALRRLGDCEDALTSTERALAAEPALLSRIDRLREAIDKAVVLLNEAWGGFGPSEPLEQGITILQHARTADDIAQGSDWPPARLASTDSEGR